MNQSTPGLDELRSLKILPDEICCRQYDSEEENSIVVYGTPEGLRSLASCLNVIADLSQESLQESDLPTGEGYHKHLPLVKRNSGDPAVIIVGRLDSKGDGKTSWFFD